MKITKRVLTIILSIALVVGGLYFVAPKNAKAEADFAITAPADASMKGAGAMDIKWEDASAIKPVSSYDVFIDGSLVKNTTDTQFEFYTTKVYFHKVWVRANFTDGTNHYTKTVRFGVTKKGLAVSEDMGRNIDPNELKIGWYYNWGINPFASTFASGKYKDIDYVPMIWGDNTPTLIKNRVKTAASRGYKYILGFNEPDIGWQQGGCNMELSRVVELWPNFMGHNIRVGSPAYSLAGIDPSDPEKAAAMFPGFMAAVENNVDHICIHAYPDGWNGGQAMANWLLDDIAGVQHQKYNKPVWITEYSTSGSGITQAGTASFVRYFNEGANSRDYIERHSFFSFNNADRPGLWDYSTGALSQSGANYRDYGNPEEDYVTGSEVNPRDTEPTTEATTTEAPTDVPPVTETSVAPTAKPSAKPTIKIKKPGKTKIKKAKNKKKRKISLKLKKIKGANGYHIRYSDSKKFDGYWEKYTKKVKVTLKKLDKGTKYYIKARAYKRVNKAIVYGKWSKKKKVKVKK